MTQNEKRALFERLCKDERVLKVANFPLGILEVNGKFHKYMDSDTDSAWIGFQMSLWGSKNG